MHKLTFLESSGSDDDVKIVKKKEKIDSNPLVQKTAYFAARRKAGSDGESDEDLTSVTFKADYNSVGYTVNILVDFYVFELISHLFRLLPVQKIKELQPL